MQAMKIVKFVRDYRSQHARSGKSEISKAVECCFRLKRQRSVYASAEVAVRFSTSDGDSFSNTILSLSALKKYDSHPFVVCLVRPTTVEFFLANSTFLKKISHSSQRLRVDKLRGSFNGSDILRNYGDTPNAPENFEKLFTMHCAFTWEENVERLVEATNAIAGIGQKFAPTPTQRESILNAPSVAASIAGMEEYTRLKSQLDAAIQGKAADILDLGAVDNVNLRGNQIEQLITGSGNTHAVADMRRQLMCGIEVQIEIKTKLLNKASAPKAYNIDKVLEVLSGGRVAIAYCFVGIDVPGKRVLTRTQSIFDHSILESTTIQPRWAGRNSRGVTQLTGDFMARVFNPCFREHIDIDEAKRFLKYLLQL